MTFRRVAVWSVNCGWRRGTSSGAFIPTLGPSPYIAAVIGFLKELDADVVGIQEVDRRTMRTLFADQGQLLADGVGMHAVYEPTVAWDRRRPTEQTVLAGGDRGHLVLTKQRPEWHSVVPLSTGDGPRSEPRDLILVGLRHRGTDYTVGETHLGVESGENTELQLRECLREMSGLTGPRLMIGDFNLETPDAQRVLAETGSGLQLVTHGQRTFRSDVYAIDHVAQEGFTDRMATVVQGPVSDHRVVVVDVTLGRELARGQEQGL